MAMTRKRRPNSYSFAEATCLDGQVVRFSCKSEDKEEVKAALAKAFEIDTPTTKRVSLAHGGYGSYTRYDIVQHHYMGGEGGFLEALEVKNAPDGRCGFIIHVYGLGKGSYFYEWETLMSLLSAYKRAERLLRDLDESAYQKMDGHLRRVQCGALTPWFYAVGDEELIGDFATPQDLSDDPNFRIGDRFWVTELDVHDKKLLPLIKTCLGCRISEYDDHGYPYHHWLERRVFFSDGSVYRQTGDDNYFHAVWHQPFGSGQFIISGREKGPLQA
jgi:hypothetical protein